jgi:polar amino acid transport system substrate-binding protein
MKHLLALLVALLCLPHPPAWAGGGGPLRISTSYTTLLSTPEQTGMLDRIVKEAFLRAGSRADIVFTATERSLVAVNDGLFDGELNRIEGIEKNFPNLVRVPEPNMQMHFVAFAKRDIPINGWESLRNLRVGIVSGWKIVERNVEGFPCVTRLMDVNNLWRMLDRGRLDVVVYSKLSGYDQLHRLGLEDIRHLAPPLCVKDMFLYLHKRHEALAAPLAEALRAMKRDGTYERIVSETTCHPH